MSRYRHQNNNTTSGGLGLSSVLTVVFVVLKLCGLIDWSWWWVLSPIWISIGLAAVVGAIVGIIKAWIIVSKRRRK